MRANNEKLTEIVLELRQLLKEQGDDGRRKPRSMAMFGSQSNWRASWSCSHLICRALRK